MYVVSDYSNDDHYGSTPFPSPEAVEWTPDVAFIVHSGGGSTLVSQHGISSGQLQSGRLVSPYELMLAAERAIKSEEEHQGVVKHEADLLPEKLIYEDAESLVWYEPSRVRQMLFRVGSSKPLRLMVPWPSLLFRVLKGKRSIEVVALKFKRRPKLDDLLYCAPLMNLYDDFTMCHGSAPLPPERSVRTLDEMSSTVFDSFFTHPNCKGFLEGDRKAQMDFWKRLSDEKVKRFPFSVLTPAKKRYGFYHSGGQMTLRDFLVR